MKLINAKHFSFIFELQLKKLPYYFSIIVVLCEKTNSVNGSLRLKIALGNYFLVRLFQGHGTENFCYREILGLDIPYHICPVVVICADG